MTAKIIILYALFFAGLNFIMIIVGRATYKDTNTNIESKGANDHYWRYPYKHCSRFNHSTIKKRIRINPLINKSAIWYMRF